MGHPAGIGIGLDPKVHRGNPVRSFFGLVLLLSLPFYALGASGAELPFVNALPISALMACVPMGVALALLARESGVRTAGRLFVRAFQCRLIPSAGWTLVALSVMPVAFAVTGAWVWLSVAPLPGLLLMPMRVIIPGFALFFLGAVGEEIGWQGYAYPRLTARHSALTAALIIGVVWALWHVVPLALMGRSVTWMVWHGLGMVLMRIIIVWLMVNAGQSLLIAVLFHMMSNSVWGVFSTFEAYYNPAMMCAVQPGFGVAGSAWCCVPDWLDRAWPAVAWPARHQPLSCVSSARAICAANLAAATGSVRPRNWHR